MVYIKDKVIAPTVENTCSVYIQGEEIKKEECELKEKMVYLMDEVITPSTVENTCSVYIQGEGIKVEECELKEEMIYIKDEDITPSTIENTCTVFVQGDVKVENTGIQGNAKIKIPLVFYVLNKDSTK